MGEMTFWESLKQRAWEFINCKIFRFHQYIEVGDDYYICFYCSKELSDV